MSALEKIIVDKNEGTTLSSLAKYKEAIISEVLSSNSALYKKLLSMGIVEGTKVKVVAKAPLGGPLNIRALGYQLSLRQSEAEHILVQPS